MNQNPEQLARDAIDKMLEASGWIVQSKGKYNLAAGMGVAAREYSTSVGPADYILFINKQPVGLIEAKREEEGVHLTVHEEQSMEYATARLKYFNNEPLRFVYESTGEVTHFTDYHDLKPRSRPVFSFHRPETFKNWMQECTTLRARFSDIPPLSPVGLRECQIQAITKLEDSLRHYKPKALVQMATGSGKTFTAITAIYRLLKFAKAKRVLFLVDTKNLGEQAEQEFRRYVPQDDNRLFPELYGVTRLSSSYIPGDSQVYISTIQRLCSILKGTELSEKDEEENPNEYMGIGRERSRIDHRDRSRPVPMIYTRPYSEDLRPDRSQPYEDRSRHEDRSRPVPTREPLPVVYNARVPMEFFDFVIIDECHRSIYNLWKQVLDYFDAFQVGLTATPDNRTFGYFNQNLVCDYGYQQAVEDGVLVPYNVFEITTKITQQGASISMGEYVGRREKLTRKQFWSTADEMMKYEI